MTRACLGLGVVLLLAACRPTNPTLTLPPAATPENRTLGPGDIIEIRVREHDDISGPYEVSDDGKIRFPWIGDVEVRGKTGAAIAEKIELELQSGWLKQPQVTVRVTERQNREVSVLGQVKEAGSLPYKPGMTVMQAISQAGGMNPLAMPRRVKLIRQTDKGRQTFEIDVTAILESRGQDFALEPGDIVFVPESPV
jgi:protein involved in polysaccharide export with SLBB domain